MKKLLSIVLTIAIIMCMVPFGAFTLEVNATTFTPRLTAPSRTGYYSNNTSTNPYSVNTSAGGGNCTWYAWGRAYEILGSRPKINTIGNACTWYTNNINSGSYPYGSTPKLGAIICWSGGSSGAGHVAVVEQINSDGTITISESSWTATDWWFRTKKISNNGYYGGTLDFQGYIYICDTTSSTEHTCNKGEYVFYEALHPHYKCYRCSICGTVWRNTSEPVTLSSCSSCTHTHSYSSSITKQPICTATGVRTYKCSCGSSYTETISALGHDYSGARLQEVEHPHQISQRCVRYSTCGGFYWTGENGSSNSCSSCWYATFTVSTSSVALKVGESKSITMTIDGCLPSTRVADMEYDTSLIEVAVSQNTLTFKGLKKGTGTFKFVIYSDSSKSHIIGSKSISITISDPTYTGKVSFDKTSISLVRPTNQSDTLTIQLSGTWPEGAGYTFEYNSNIISMSQNGTELTITANEEGKTDFIINIVNKNNNNARITYAVCSITVKNETYTIKYDANGGTGAPSDQIKTYGQKLNLRGDIPEREGYIFKGWSYFKSATTVKYKPGDALAANLSSSSDTITLYAVWEEITLVNIKAIWPDKQLYYMGDLFDTTGLKLRLEYSDGSTSIIDSGYTISGFDSSTTGEKTITVSYGGKTDRFEVHVREPYIELSHTNLNMKVGEVQTIKAYTDPDGESVKWSTSDSSVATVSNGRITAVGAGTAVITVHFYYNGYNYYDTCEVAVEKDVVIGDANGDSKVNTRDAAIVMQYANGWNVTVDLDVADVNGDEAVNTRDYALLMQYANGWHVELK